MKLLRLSGIVSILGLAVASHASAQGILAPILNAISSYGQNTGASAIGPDGTYYVVVPAATSTASMPATEVMAIGVAATPATNWTASVTGNVSSILPGITNVYLVQNAVSGFGRNFTTTTTVLPLSVAKGAQGTAITLTGSITDLEVRTVGGADYLYIVTVATSTTKTGGTTTTTTTRELTIYSQTGAVIKTVAL